MEVKINIRCDNAAFDPCPEFELSRILYKLGASIENDGDLSNHRLLDSNSNHAGDMVVSE